MAPAECAAFLEAVDDIAAARKVADCIADLGMRFQGQDLTVDAKAPDAVVPAIDERSHKRLRIVPAQLGKTLLLAIPCLFV